MEILNEDLSQEQVAREADELAQRALGVSRHAAFERLARGDFRGTILEAKLSMLRFLLREDQLPQAAE